MTESIDRERALFRFLSKSARKGEPADAAAAADRVGVETAGLPEIVEAMQARIGAAWPDAPALALLLGTPDAAALAAIGVYDWVPVGVYTFGLPPTKTRSGSAESAAHRALKEWAAAHPEHALAPFDAVAVTERWFPSGDEADVAFLGPDAATIVEVRPADAEAHELRRALFALVKLRAVLSAEDELEGRDRAISAVLLTTASVSADLAALAAQLAVEIREVSPPP